MVKAMPAMSDENSLRVAREVVETLPNRPFFVMLANM